jgi:microcompartment protein CcmK/EutM
MSQTVVRNAKHDSLNLGRIANGALVKGQNVKLDADGRVSKVTAGTQLPFGIVEVGGADGARVAIRTFIAAEVYGIAKVDLVPGKEVVATGVVNADGKQEFTLAVAGNFVNAVVIKGATATNECLVGIIDGVYQKNP